MAAKELEKARKDFNNGRIPRGDFHDALDTYLRCHMKECQQCGDQQGYWESLHTLVLDGNPTAAERQEWERHVDEVAMEGDRAEKRQAEEETKQPKRARRVRSWEFPPLSR